MTDHLSSQENEMDNTQILYLAGAFLIGFIIAWFAGRSGPTRAAEEAAAETETVRRKLRTVESDLRKTEGQLKENLATLDQMAAEKESLVKLLKASEQRLTDASAELNRLHAALRFSHDAQLQLKAELQHTRGALSGARLRSAALAAEKEAAAEAAAEASEAAGPTTTTALAERVEVDALAERMVALESELALARATAERLAEKEVLVSAELYLRRREYSDIVAGGEDAIAAALAARDRAIADAQNRLDYMRRDLSMLTAAGAQIAAALEQRNSEYAVLLNRIAAEETARLTTPTALTVSEEEVEPVVPTVDLPDFQAELDAHTAELDELKNAHENLKAVLEEAISAREALQQQLDERISEIEGLNSAVTAAQEQLAALSADKEALMRRLAGRSTMISGLLDKIGAYDLQLRSILATATQAASNGNAGEGAEQAAEEIQMQPVAQEEEGETHVS
jgi:chromosome segregation ATPase